MKSSTMLMILSIVSAVLDIWVAIKGRPVRPKERQVKMLAPVALLAVATVIIVPAGHQNKPGERHVVFEQSGVQLVLDMVTAKELRCQNGRCVEIEDESRSDGL